MTAERLVVVGAGGFGRETLDIIDAINEEHPATFELLGVLDDGPTELHVSRLRARATPFLGPVDAWLARDGDARFVVAIGAPATRRRMVEQLDKAGLQAVTLVHPRAVLGSVGTIGTGTVVCAGVQVSTNVHLGRHVHLNPNATVGHDSVLEEYVSINPAATISGECRVRSSALVGAAAVVLQGLVVGSCALVGAGACVVRNVPENAVVKGVPAR